MVVKKYLYLDVILRTSIFPALFGVMVAVHSSTAEITLASAAALITAITGIMIIQGIIEHSLDVLKDRGGYSAFRPEHVSEEERARLLRLVKVATASLVPLAVIMIVLKRPWELLIGVMAYRSAKLYVDTHNEWYSTFGFMLSFSAGYFAFSNAPTTAWLLGAMITGFVMKASQAMYRLDDYLEDESVLTSNLIQYYRNVFRSTLHLVPLASAALLAYPAVTVNYTLWWVWLAGVGVFAAQTLKLKDRVRQEVNITPLIASVIAVEVASGSLSARYLFSAAVAVYVFARFWTKRHGMCNIFTCPDNPLNIRNTGTSFRPR